MKIKILRSTVALKKFVFPGDILEVSQGEAVTLICGEKAEAFEEPLSDEEEPKIVPDEVPSIEQKQEQPKSKRNRK